MKDVILSHSTTKMLIIIVDKFLLKITKFIGVTTGYTKNVFSFRAYLIPLLQLQFALTTVSKTLTKFRRTSRSTSSVSQ